MKAYILSLGAGLIVGIVYSLMGVRSPAPPVIALVGWRESCWVNSCSRSPGAWPAFPN